MKYVLTQTHYEYNDETYNSPDAEKGKEPGTPVAIFDDPKTAEDERWKREIEEWISTYELPMYIDGFNVHMYSNPSRPYELAYNAEVTQRIQSYADIVGIHYSEVKFGYDFKLPQNLSDEQVRKIIELFDGPVFYNVFKVE